MIDNTRETEGCTCPFCGGFYKCHPNCPIENDDA